MALRFAGFELDQQRVELRGRGGEAIKLRPKSFDMLTLFAANAGRVLSKQELMEAVWPNVHVGEDSLFQCIREIRAALGDDQRQMIKLVSGRGYRFEAAASSEPAGLAARPQAASHNGAAPVEPGAGAPAQPARTRRPFGLRGSAAFATVAGLAAVLGLAVAALIFGPDLISGRTLPAIAVIPISGLGNDPDVTPTAANVTIRLTDGLAKIDKIRVMAAASAQVARAAPTGETGSLGGDTAVRADFVLSGELEKSERSWELRARMTRTATREVEWTASVSVDINDTDLQLQRLRLAAGAGHRLALRINELVHSGARPDATDGGSSPGHAKVVVEQATASINQTTRERFAAAQTMLEKALAADPDNVDLEMALAALQLRGIQMVWYSPEDGIAAEANARSILERALRAKPDYIPVLEAYCRFLTATNLFVDSLVACARTLSFDPWNGLALYHIGITQIQLGRFDDALAAFRQAEQFDTPQVSRWTWLLGAGWADLLMGRDEDAISWLQRSIAITPASGRTHMLLAAAYQRLGRPDEAKAALAKGMELRPGSTALNVGLPKKNVSPVYLEASQGLIRTLVEIGLPER